MSLDIETLFFASALSRCAYLVVFLVIVLRQPGEWCLWHWIGALVSSMIGSFIMAQIPPTDEVGIVKILVVYVLFAMSLSLSWSGVRLFYGRRTAFPPLGALTLLPALVYVAILGTGLSPQIALCGTFAGCMVLAGLTIWEIMRPSQVERLWTQYVVATAFSGYFAIFAVSIVTTAFLHMETRTVESGRLSIIVDQVGGIFIYFGYLAMAGERASLKLRHLAEIDSLTGLLNRRGLETLTLSGAVPSTGGPPTSVLLADIDHFKSINDTHGHQAGDMVLKAFSARMKESLRVSDIAVRWGGEEFLVVLPETGIDRAANVAERLRAAVAAEPFETPSGSIVVTVSIGISELGRGERDLEPATRRADAALYAAKSSGRNQVSLFKEDRLQAVLAANASIPTALAS